MYKLGDIINVGGYAVEYAGKMDNPNEYRVEIRSGKLYAYLGENYPEDTILYDLYATLIPMVLNYNERRDFPNFTYTDGSTVTVLGKPFTLHWVTVDEDVYEDVGTVKGNPHMLYVLMHEPSAALAKSLFFDYLREACGGYACQRFSYWLKKLGFEQTKLFYDDLDDAWATCTYPFKIITISNLLLTQEKDFVDKSLVHEIVHYTHKEHDLDFYLTFKQYMPDYYKVTPAVIKPTLPNNIE